MNWAQIDTIGLDGQDFGRFGHSASGVDARDTWSTELVVVYGGVGAPRPAQERMDPTEQYTAMGDVIVLQLDTLSWQRPDVSSVSPGPRAFHCAAVIGRKIYVHGGHVLSFDMEQNKKKRNFFNDLWVLDTDVWTWSRVDFDPQISPPKRDMAAMVAVGSTLWLFGGRGEQGRALSDLWSFNIATSSWSAIRTNAPSPGARKMHSMVLVNNRIMLFGGERDSGVLDDLWTLRGLDSSEPFRWTQIKVRPSPSGRFGHAMAVGLTRVAVFGGCQDSSTFLSLSRQYAQSRDLWVLEIATFGWLKVEFDEGAELPSERMCHTLTPLSGGRMLLLGGRRGREGIPEDVWVFNGEGELPGPTAPPSVMLPAVLPAGSVGGAMNIAGTPEPSEPASPTASATAQKALSSRGPSQQSLFQSLLQPLKRDAPPPKSPPNEAADVAGPGGGVLEPLSIAEMAAPDAPRLPSVDSAAVAVTVTRSDDVAATSSVEVGSAVWRSALMGPMASSAINRLSNTVSSTVNSLLGKAEEVTGLNQRLSSISINPLSRFSFKSPSSPLAGAGGAAGAAAAGLGGSGASAASGVAIAATPSELAALQALRLQKFGLPAVPPPHRAPPPPPPGGTVADIAQELEGQNDGSSAGSAWALAAVRRQLCSAEASSLPFLKVAAMLEDYKQLAAQQVAAQLSSGPGEAPAAVRAALAALSRDGRHRFAHVMLPALRVTEISQLQSDYSALCAAMAGGGGAESRATGAAA